MGTCFWVTRERTVKAGPQNFMPSEMGMIERSTLPLLGIPIQSNPSRTSLTRRPSNSLTISFATTRSISCRSFSRLPLQFPDPLRRGTVRRALRRCLSQHGEVPGVGSAEEDECGLLVQGSRIVLHQAPGAHGCAGQIRETVGRDAE